MHQGEQSFNVHLGALYFLYVWFVHNKGAFSTVTEYLTWQRHGNCKLRKHILFLRALASHSLYCFLTSVCKSLPL